MSLELINNDLDFANMIFPFILYNCLCELNNEQIIDLAKNINIVFGQGHWIHKRIMIFAIDILESWKLEIDLVKKSAKKNKSELFIIKFNILKENIDKNVFITALAQYNSFFI